MFRHSEESLIPVPKASIRQQVVGNSLYVWSSDCESGSSSGTGALNQCLNSGEAVVWMLCDGRRSAADIAEQIAAAYGLTYAEAHRRVVGILEAFQRLGLLRD